MPCRSALFREIAQGIVAIIYWLLGQPMGIFFFLPSIRFSETSVRNYRQTLRNFPGELRFHLLHGRNLKWRNGGVATLVRNLGIWWRGMVSVTACPLVLQESRSGHFGEENNVMYLPAIEPRISGRSSSVFRIKLSLCLDCTLYR